MLYVLFACNDPLGSTGADAPLVGRGVDTAVDRPDTGSTDTDTPIDTARDTARDTALVDTAAGDSGDTGVSDTGPVRPVLVPDFALADLNPASSRYEETISPRDYIGRVSGYYFVHST